MKTSISSKSAPRQILASAGVMFLLIGFVALGLVIYFIAKMEPTNAVLPEQEIDFYSGDWWVQLLPYLETHKKPILFLLMFVLTTEFGLLFLILSCLSLGLFESIFGFLGRVYTEIKNLLIGLISWLLSILKKPVDFVIRRFTPLQSTGIFLTILFSLIGSFFCEVQEVFFALCFLTLGVSIGSLIETKKKAE